MAVKVTPPEPLVPSSRRRDPQSHAAILQATVEILEEGGYRNLTIEGVARRAGVGKQTIYRWWQGSKPALVLEAFTQASDEGVDPPDTGSVRADLLAILEPVFQMQVDPHAGTGLANRTLMAEAQLNPDFHARYVELHRHWWGPMLVAVTRGVERGELVADTQPGMVVDLLLGFGWYRLLLEHAPLNSTVAVSVVDAVLNGVGTAGHR